MLSLWGPFKRHGGLPRAADAGWTGGFETARGQTPRSLGLVTAAGARYPQQRTWAEDVVAILGG